MKLLIKLIYVVLYVGLGLWVLGTIFPIHSFLDALLYFSGCVIVGFTLDEIPRFANKLDLWEETRFKWEEADYYDNALHNYMMTDQDEWYRYVPSWEESISNYLLKYL